MTILFRLTIFKTKKNAFKIFIMCGIVALNPLPLLILFYKKKNIFITENCSYICLKQVLDFTIKGLKRTLRFRF